MEDAGSLLQVFDAPASSFVAIFLAALEIWPETTWGMLAPHAYFVHQRTFPDRRSIGWIGFCPHPLRATDFPAATELVDIPGRGTLLLNGREPMDETRREHFERVGEADIKLMELGYLPRCAVDDVRSKSRLRSVGRIRHRRYSPRSHRNGG